MGFHKLPFLKCLTCGISFHGHQPQVSTGDTIKNRTAAWASTGPPVSSEVPLVGLRLRTGTDTGLLGLAGPRLSHHHCDRMIEMYIKEKCTHMSLPEFTVRCHRDRRDSRDKEKKLHEEKAAVALDSQAPGQRDSPEAIRDRGRTLHNLRAEGRLTASVVCPCDTENYVGGVICRACNLSIPFHGCLLDLGTCRTKPGQFCIKESLAKGGIQWYSVKGCTEDKSECFKRTVNNYEIRATHCCHRPLCNF
ncbi:hypothetical protein U0070_003652 [Myodes glareolus]|uniref:Uncharacterized protein n=1 Tax=Myodes glareolus TaxID=447135 RepID=A0AAW0HIJ1_MYOGA